MILNLILAEGFEAVGQFLPQFEFLVLLDRQYLLLNCLFGNGYFLVLKLECLNSVGGACVFQEIVDLHPLLGNLKFVSCHNLRGT